MKKLIESKKFLLSINIIRGKMKLKSKVLTAILIVSFLFAGTAILRSQGFYNEKTSTQDQNNSDKSVRPEDSGGNGFFRAPGDDGDDFGGGGEERPPAPGDDDPIGEGVLILSLLAGGYTLIKRNVRKKYED